ncbi:hypothetical protein PITC_095860 [Penicillium italicum]|uniref:Short-chain dehydrogenase/reductase SDR n=1 Tax=Penicillium italicum TaxID=40296 RepID=A0A0A2KQI2_PENIT|nr:hypothetical protein PITC_095860 [Penicillium italicum]
MTPTIASVTGANRGLGFGLLKLLMAKPNYAVVAAVRDPAHPTAKDLSQLSTGEGSRIIAINKGDDHVGNAVTNAGIAKVYALVKDFKRANALENIEVNILSVVFLDQATRPLLGKSISKPVYSIIGSRAGGLGCQPPVPSAAYGASKSILPWYGVRNNSEDKWLNTFVLDSGWVQTDMGNGVAKRWGLESAPDTVDKSTSGMVDLIVNGTKQQYGGKVILNSGKVQEW